MTPEFGAASQLEKIDMLDFADFVAINKFDRKGAQDALRDVRKQVQRNREQFKVAPDEMPVFGTMAARFNDDGVTALYQALAAKLAEKGLKLAPGKLERADIRHSSKQRRDRAGRRGFVFLPKSPMSCVATIARHSSKSRIARERQQLRADAPDAHRIRGRQRADGASLAAIDAHDQRFATGQAGSAREKAARHVAGGRRRLMPATNTS
jgi:methylmalonyl-CoA mutase